MSPGEGELMKLLRETIGNPVKPLAIFWSPKGCRQQFHADVWIAPGEAMADVLARYRRMFPGDTIRSVRNATGRFQAFK